MDPVISSFIFKFQNLCRAGKDAKLSFTSKNGKTNVNLNLQIGSFPPLPEPHPQHVPEKRRNGPSRERRRLKRANARKLVAEEAFNSLSTDEVEVLAIAEKAEREAARNDPKDTSERKVNDEFCSDSDYHEENTSEKVVEEIVIKPDSETDL